VSIHVAGVIILALVFVAGTLRPVNIGVFALIATFILGVTLGGEDADSVLAGFPADIFVLLIGVTYLFGLAATNGTLEWLVDKATRMFGDRPALVPWLIFAFSAIPTLAGALGPAGVGMMAPLCLRLGERYGLSRRMSALMTMHGSCAGNFSPLNGLAIIAQSAASNNGIEVSSMALFLGNLAYNIALGVFIYFAFGGVKLLKAARAQKVAASVNNGSAQEPANSAFTDLIGRPAKKIRVDQVFTIIAIVIVAIVALGFSVDLGFTSLIAAALLHSIFPNYFKGADKKIVWSVILLIGGIMTLVAAMERYGTIEWAGSGIASIGSPLLVAFLLCFVAALTSAFGSSAGLIGTLIPLAVPFIATGDINATWIVVALCISATVVDAMPFSSVGALTLSTAPEDERPKLMRFQLGWGAGMIISAPILTWLTIVLPSMA